jgi:putative transcriptional regulator
MLAVAALLAACPAAAEPGAGPGDLRFVGTKLSAGRLLVATRRLMDPRFSETVILLIEYGRDGAVGLILNRPSKVTLATIFPEMEGAPERSHTVYYGGPVSLFQIMVLVRSSQKPEDATRVFGDVYLSTNRSLLERLVAEPREREVFRAYAGYAGWGREQLDGEIARGDWEVTEADAEIAFDEDPTRLWPMLILRGSLREALLRAPFDRTTRSPTERHCRVFCPATPSNANTDLSTAALARSTPRR